MGTRLSINHISGCGAEKIVGALQRRTYDDEKKKKMYSQFLVTVTMAACLTVKGKYHVVRLSRGK